MIFARNSLGRRIVTLMILASAGLSLIAAAVQLYFGYRDDLGRVMGELEIVETSFLSGLENALWQFNFDQAELLLDGIYAQADITSVRLIAVTGEIFERGRQDDTDAVTTTFDLIHTSRDGSTRPLGVLQVDLTLAKVQARLWSQFLTLLASNFVKTMAASLVMMLIFDRMVGRHLRATAGYISTPDWDLGDNALRLDRHQRDDDLGRVVNEVNASRLRIQTSRAEAMSLSDRLEAILNATASGIVAFDRSGRIAMINRNAQHMLGLLENQLPARWPSEVAFLDHENMNPLEASRNPIERVLVGQTIRNEVAIVTRKNGAEPRYMRLSSERLTEETSPDLCAVVVFDDVSEQEKNRQQVERASRLDALGQLTGGVAHDFNNLLTTISYGVALARSTDDSAKRDRYLETAILSVDRGSALTRRLLAFAKRQPGQAKSQTVSLILEEFEALARPTIEEMIDIEITSSAGYANVFCDVAQLENALLNLVINARDAIMRSGKGSRIQLRARTVDELDPDTGLKPQDVFGPDEAGGGNLRDRLTSYIEFAVTDDGPGMSEEVRRRATDPFFTTKATNSGTGLGLSMVYGFIQQSDGHLRIYSEPGQGTTVRLLLPRSTEAGAPMTPIDPTSFATGAGQSILIVEDEPQLSEVMQDLLQSFGYEVIHSANGNGAIEILKSGTKVDCLLTDIVMPENMNGFELAEQARSLRPEMPVIYMSGYAGFSKDQMGSVVAPIISKPSSPAELSLAVRAALETRRS